jgi:hypothetical protein
MENNTPNLDAFINDIVDRVLNKIERELPEDETVQGTLAIFTSYVPSAKSAIRTLTQKYGEDIECSLFGEAEFEHLGFSSVRVCDGMAQNQLMQKAAGKGRIVLVTPKLGLLEKIAQGNDDGFVEHVFLRSLLWGRKACILLDFVKPKFKRGTFFEKITDIIDSLTAMGVEVSSYTCSGEKTVSAYSLVTENDVIAAQNRGESSILLAEDAIITPLAAEKARELDIRLD